MHGKPEYQEEGKNFLHEIKIVKVMNNEKTRVNSIIEYCFNSVDKNGLTIEPVVSFRDNKSPLKTRKLIRFMKRK
jgi:hypothetical protein